MTGKTHLTFGLATGVIAATIIDPDSIILGTGIMGCAILGSLMPDIDHRTSKIGKKAKPISLIVSKMFGHRGFVHTPVCLIITCLFISTLLAYFGLKEYNVLLMGYAIGYAGHLLLDMLTKGGIPLLYPFNRKKFHLTNIKTGGKGEKALLIFAFIVAIIISGLYMAKDWGVLSI